MRNRNQTNSTKDLADRFRSFEVENDLFNMHIDKIPIWERIRFRTFRDIKHQNMDIEQHGKKNKQKLYYIKAGYMFAKNLVVRNPYSSSRAKIMFIGSSRRKKDSEGDWCDIYCDPIHSYCNYDYVHFEAPRLQSLEHLQPAKTKRLRFLDLILYSGTLQRKLGIKQPEISTQIRERLKNISDEINQEFNSSVDLIEKARENLHRRNTELWLYQELIERVDPEVIVLIQGYGKETLIEVCQEKNVTVVELQHGVIHQDHFGYAYPEPRTKEMFPDYLLVWGDFWKNRVEYPIPNQQVLSTGYPYFEQQRSQCVDMKSKDQILFISQDEIGDRLSKFACEVDQHPGIEYGVVFKLHPNEFNGWRENYPWLIKSDIEVIDSSKPPLYQLFSESRVQVGAYSTAIYEGLGFDLETYLYDCPGVERLQSLVDNGTATRVSSAEQIASAIGRKQNRFDRKKFFRPNATDNTCKILNKLVSGGSAELIS